MPSQNQPAPAWKEYPEPEFPHDQARAAYQRAKRIIKDAWQRMQAGEMATDLGDALASKGITSLPPEIGQLTALTRLWLYNNLLTALPPEIGQLTALTEIYLSDNHLTALPPEIGHLTALKALHLSNNRLTALPREIGQLTAMTGLFLSRNLLTALPPEIGQLTAMRGLDLYNNRLTALPPEIGELTALAELDLSYNRLKALPPEIGRLTALRELRLRDNELTVLPPEIGQLTALRVFFLHNNELTALPSEIGQLTVLRDLRLRYNELRALPPQIGQIAALTRLRLEDNELTALPPELKGLRKLRGLYLHGNEGLGLPPEVLGKAWDKTGRKDDGAAEPRGILDYYFARLEQGEAPMQEVRMLLVGRGRVGKTSLLRGLLGRPFDKDEKETPGITVEMLPLACEKGEARAHVWDFGGQEFLHGTHQIFLSERCVYVLVLEGREGNWETESDYWLRFIQSYGGTSPVVVVLNKSAGHPFTVDRYKLKRQCPQIAGFVETDAGTGLGIGELRGLLAATVNGMPHVWTGVAKKWHAIKEVLTRMPDSWLDYPAYRKLCAENGVEDEGQQDSLAITLHELGLALNFRDHHRLRHTSVLKPQWVTNAIYGLIRYTQKRHCHGVLEEGWLGEALTPAEEYPREKHDFVVELMERFEVAFRLEGSRDRWLLPELLPEEQPEAFAQFDEPGVRRLRFTYPQALPPGLLPRFIVRTHELSAAHPDWRWRSGVVLQWGSCQALVRLDRLSRMTEVSVRDCPLHEMQDLFDLVRAHLVVLHGNVKAVEETGVPGHPEEWILVPKLRNLDRKGERETTEVFASGEEAVVPVPATLHPVESPAATKAAGPDPERRMHLFISYAHENEAELKPLRAHLTLLSQQGYIQVWHDRDLVPGEKWERGILEELHRAETVLLFYTTKARVSKFIQETELTVSLDRADAGDCTLLWVPLERKDLRDDHPLEKRLKALQSATVDAQCIYEFNPHALGWMQVEQAIQKAVEKRRAGRG